MQNRTVIGLIAIFLVIGLLIGGLLNERKLSKLAKTKIEFSEELKKCEVIGEQATEYGQGLTVVTNETLLKWHVYLNISRSYFLCIQKVYGFEK